MNMLLGSFDFVSTNTGNPATLSIPYTTGTVFEDKEKFRLTSRSTSTSSIQVDTLTLPYHFFFVLIRISCSMAVYVAKIFVVCSACKKPKSFAYSGRNAASGCPLLLASAALCTLSLVILPLI